MIKPTEEDTNEVVENYCRFYPHICMRFTYSILTFVYIRFKNCFNIVSYTAGGHPGDPVAYTGKHTLKIASSSQRINGKCPCKTGSGDASSRW